MEDKPLFEQPSPGTVQFGVRALGLQAAQMVCREYEDAKARFAAAKPHSPDRSTIALEIQHAKRDLAEAVRTNRAHFKLIAGDKA